jgi:hypothetical protein
MNSEEMSIAIKLHPFVLYSKIPVGFQTNAKILDTRKDWKIAPGGSLIVGLKRDLSKSFTFKAQVGDGAEEISLPPRQDFKFQRELRYSKDVTRYGHACNECHDSHQICVVLDGDDDAVIVPRTAKFVDVVHREDGIRTTVVPVDNYSPKQACLQGSQTVGANGANANVCGYAIAEVLVKVPLDAKTSTKAAQPAYMVKPCQ